MPKRLDKHTWFSRCEQMKSKNVRYEISLWPDDVTGSKPVPFTCTIHGVFNQRPSDHVKGSGCPKCGSLKAGKSNSQTKYHYLEKFKDVHGERYEYHHDLWPKVMSNKTKVEASCKVHGLFKLTPNNHISLKAGCPTCGMKSRTSKRTYDRDKWLSVFREVHGDTYDYSDVKWGDVVNMTTKINVICREHGGFDVSLNQHQRGHGCPSCSGRTFRFFYLNDVEGICLKFGVTSNPQVRLQRQNMLNKHFMSHLSMWEFEDSTRPIELESLIKSQVKPAMTKNELLDGYSETCSYKYLDMIVSLIESNGGVKVIG